MGASWAFISRPYIRRGIINGLLSAALAIAALILALGWVYRLMPDLETLRDVNGTLAIFTLLTVLGILISGLSTYFVVNRFLKMRVDDLY